MISVITPVYNSEQFIEGCIQNVIEQGCHQVEHIIVDGNSTDRTVEIIKKYADQYQHIKWISEPDQGQSDAMNKGISMANGFIISFLNVDDYYSPNVLNRVLEVFASLPEPSLLVGNCNVWNEKGEIIEVNKPHRLSLFDLLTVQFPNNFQVQMPTNPSAYFYHTSLHQKIGLYNTQEHYALDIDFLLRAVQVATSIYLDEDFGNYRFIPGTKTFQDAQNNQRWQRFVNLLKSYEKDLSGMLRIKFYALGTYIKIKHRLWLLKRSFMAVISNVMTKNKPQ